MLSRNWVRAGAVFLALATKRLKRVPKSTSISKVPRRIGTVSMSCASPTAEIASHSPIEIKSDTPDLRHLISKTPCLVT